MDQKTGIEKKGQAEERVRRISSDLGCESLGLNAAQQLQNSETLLIAAGADTNIKNHEGVTAVQQVRQWQFHIMETLQNLMPPDNTSREE
ncbi:ankyrin repeat domain-containing protein 2 isoform X2 [Scomber scombrus]|uniref:Ankyrin repeat domain-containing protein 2 isoform X2 n=1 Tax=Scomber scombrus TaxID=13677 RepID=A0AAV1N286_SCOSC